MKVLPLKVAVSEDKTQLQPSRHHFFFFTQANQIGQTHTMNQVCELVGYYLGWVKPGEKERAGGSDAMAEFRRSHFFVVHDARRWSGGQN
jgi:hypothetical protein